MNMRKIIAGIISVIFLLTDLCVAGAAQHEINYIKALNGDTVTVSGTVKDGGGREVLLRIEYANNPLLSDTDQMENSVIYQKQVTADANGGFSFDVKLKDIGEDPYTLRLGVLGDDNDISETFVFYGSEYRSAALQAIASAQRKKDADALKEAVETYYPNLYLETPLFDAYLATDPDMRETKALLVDYPVITTVPMLEGALEGVVIVKDLKQCSGCEAMEEVLGEYDTKLNILNSSVYRKTYDGLSRKLKEQVYGAFKKQSYYTPSEIKDSFILTVLNTYLANAVGADAVKTVLRDNAALLGITASDYNLSDAKLLKMIGKSFSSVADVKKTLESIKKSKEESSQSSGGSGGGSSGGSSGGSGSVLSPALGENTVIGAIGDVSYPFTDMEEYVWAKEAVLRLYQSGVLNGVGEQKFAPERVITREEFLKLLVNGFGLTASWDNGVSFSDVVPGAWYEPFVMTGVASGIVKGMGDGRFGVGSPIARQDMIVMLYRAVCLKNEQAEIGGTSGFEDFEAIADYAKAAVRFAETNEIANGMGDGNFHPELGATRAESSVILYRAIEYLKSIG